VAGGTPAAKIVDTFVIDITKNTVTTGTSGSASAPPKTPTRKKSAGKKSTHRGKPKRKK